MLQRADYALRSCLSLSFLVFLSLDESVEGAFSHDGRHPVGISFAAFACIISQELTFGGTVFNALCIISGALLATVSSSLAFVAFGGEGLPEAAVYPLIFVFSVVVSFLDVPVLSKKIALSLAALNVVNYTFSAPASVTAWWWLQDVLFGCACALVGTVLPFPRLASVDLESKARSNSALVSALYLEVIACWLFTKVEKLAPAENSGAEAEEAAGADASAHCIWSRARNRHWRRVLMVLAAVRTMRRRRLAHIALPWQHAGDAAGRFASLATRIELRKLAEDDLALMTRRSMEAKTGPRFLRAAAKYPGYVELLRSLLLVQRYSESRLASLQDLVERNVARRICKQFMSQPDLRRTLTLLAEAFAHCLAAAAAWLTHDDDGDRHTEALAQSHDLLLAALSAFDAAYHRGRVVCYYEKNIPHVPAVLLSMNNLIFYLRHSVTVLSAYCLEHLPQKASALVDGQEKGNVAPCGTVDITATITANNNSTTSSSSSNRGSSISIITRLCPCFRLPSRDAAVSSLSIAAAMTLGALYGLRNARPQPFLACFTISYLFGGGATGVNVATSVLRAAGTAVACLYTLIITVLASSLHRRGSESDDRLLACFAVVVFVFPCTYIRSTPPIGYAGTVAAFSAALLLLAPLTTGLAINRLIDTMIGIALYLSFECAFGLHIETTILRSLRACVADLETSFVSCLVAFRTGQRLGEPADHSALSSRQQMEQQQQQQQKKQQTPQTDPARAPAALPSRELLIYSRLEPSLFGAPHFHPAALERLVDELERSRQHLGFLRVVVDASLQLAVFRVLPLQAHMESIDASVALTVRTILASLDGEGEGASEGNAQASSPRALLASIFPHSWGRSRWTAHSLTAQLRVAPPPLPQTAAARLALGSASASASGERDCVMVLSEDEDRILLSFANLVNRLQFRVGGSGTAPGEHMANAELIVACAFLGGLQDLLASLKALKGHVDRMREHRRVRTLLL